MAVKFGVLSKRAGKGRKKEWQGKPPRPKRLKLKRVPTQQGRIVARRRLRNFGENDQPGFPANLFLYA
jgi:hypothetical protein